MDSRCHKLTASFVRRSNQRDKSVPVCLFFEVCITKVQRSFLMAIMCSCHMVIMFTHFCSFFRDLMKKVAKRQYHLEYMTWYVELHAVREENRILLTKTICSILAPG